MNTSETLPDKPKRINDILMVLHRIRNQVPALYEELKRNGIKIHLFPHEPYEVVRALFGETHNYGFTVYTHTGEVIIRGCLQLEQDKLVEWKDTVNAELTAEGFTQITCEYKRLTP